MKILPYSDKTLAQELSNEHTSIQVIMEKNQFLYFKEYFGENGLKIKTIVCEEHYISKDYLKDFSAYYASCFRNYDKACKRLHFFTNPFTLQDFSEALTNDKKDFWENYSGYIVVKPLPYTTIGTSVLKNYPKESGPGLRFFWGTRQYKIHLWGKELLLDSLAFQEQDTVLSACATSAIWSMLHRASEDYSITLKTPGEITKDAGEMIPNKGRLLPNKEGLEVNQMLKAIENSGLEVEVRLSKDNEPFQNKYLQKLLNAYAPIGLPLILILKVPSGFENIKALPRDTPKNIRMGTHAVTVSGFHKKLLSSLNEKTGRANVYNLIEKIYCHDDQWGPFARFELIGKHELSTPWSKFHPSNLQPSTLVEGIIIPVFPKIRISYDDIEPLIAWTSEVLKYAYDSILSPGQVWDIRVMYSEDLKAEVRSSFDINVHDKIKALTKSFPKYVWVGTCYSKEVRIADFVFDATDISNGMNGVKVIFYFNELKAHLKKFLAFNPEYENYIPHSLKSRYFKFLLEEIED